MGDDGGEVLDCMSEGTCGDEDMGKAMFDLKQFIYLFICLFIYLFIYYLIMFPLENVSAPAND